MNFETYKEIPALTKEKIERLAKTSSPRDAALLMFMFDSGTIAEELFNIRLEDLKEEQNIASKKSIFGHPPMYENVELIRAYSNCKKIEGAFHYLG